MKFPGQSKVTRLLRHRKQMYFLGVFLVMVMVSAYYTSSSSSEHGARGRRYASQFVEVGDPASEGILHRRLMRLKQYIYDTDLLQNYVSSNISQLQNLQFLPSLKNPCFLVNENIRYEEDAKQRKGSKISLRCVPYYYLAGFQKCGTSDLYLRFLRHPDVEDASGIKEPHFWKRDYSFENYTQMFQHGASHIIQRAGGMLDLLQKTPRNTPINMHQTSYQFEDNSYASVIQGDFSATTIRIPPAKISALYNFFPQSKIIVMMRDPIDRALSHYLMDIKYGTLKGQPTAKAFHEYCRNLIECINLKTRDLDLDLDNTHCKGDWVLTLGIYQFYIKRWLDIVPRENMYFIQFEEYIQQPSSLIQTGLVPFLGLNKLKPNDLDFIDKQFVNNPGIHQVRMLKETRKMLQDFYRPHNRWLSDLVGDKKFTWSLI